MSQQSLDEQTYEALFGASASKFDLKEGTIVSNEQAREILITVDTLHGVYRSLSHETGDAWRVVLKNCGYFWGKRVYAQLSKLLTAKLGRELGDLSVKEFCELFENYLQYHGWGVARIDLTHAESAGLVRVSLANSIMVQALDNVKGTVDFLVAGMLRGVFEEISGQELDCHQLACERDSETGFGEFFVSGLKRISAFEKPEAPTTVSDAVGYLSAA